MVNHCRVFAKRITINLAPNAHTASSHTVSKQLEARNKSKEKKKLTL